MFHRIAHSFVVGMLEMSISSKLAGQLPGLKKSQMLFVD